MPLSSIPKLASIVNQASRRYGVSHWETVRRLHSLRTKERYGIEEAYRLGLLHPELTKAQREKFISRENLLALQSRLSSRAYSAVLDNKGLFYRYCLHAGLPTPKLHAYFFPDKAGCDHQGHTLAGSQAWKTFFTEALTQDFVAKGILSDYGSCVRVYQRQADQWQEYGGERFTTDTLLTHLSNLSASGLVLQERVYNHPELLKLSPSPFLQTIRFVMLVDNNGERHNIYTLFRPIASDAVLDNFNNYDGGVILARVDYETGVLRKALYMKDAVPGAVVMDTHPVSKQPFAGFALPCWPQVLELVQAAVRAFLPLRFVGWDVAITPDGPRLIEGNSFFDTNYLYDKKPLLEATAQSANTTA